MTVEPVKALLVQVRAYLMKRVIRERDESGEEAADEVVGLAQGTPDDAQAIAIMLEFLGQFE